MNKFKENLKYAWEENRTSFIINLISVLLSIVAVISSTICMIEEYWS